MIAEHLADAQGNSPEPTRKTLAEEATMHANCAPFGYAAIQPALTIQSLEIAAPLTG